MSAPPDDAAALTRAALDHFAAGRSDEAERCADRLITAHPQDANGHYLKGVARLLADDPAAALRALAAASKRAPRQPLIETARGRALLALDRLGEARAAFETAVAASPEHAEAWLKLGEIHERQERRADAERAFERAAAAPSYRGAALCALAELVDGRGDAARALEIANAAAAADPGPAPRLVRARLLLKQGQPADVVAELTPALAAGAWSPANRSIALGLIGEAQHALGDHAQAFEAFAAANAVTHAALAAATFPRTLDLSLAEVRATRAALKGAETRTRALLTAKPDADDARAPVFLIGFPRSGTTLLDQILASHSCVGVVEEQQHLAEGFAAIDAPMTADPGFVADLSEKKKEAFRKRYRAALRARLDGRPDVIVDKYPLLLVWAPFIRALWPGAKFILALRDPRDAVFSAFQKRFGMNAAMREMLSLETAAAYYNEAMGLFQDFAEIAPDGIHAVRYEDVIADFDATVAPLLAFLGVDWEDGVRDYRRTAAARAVRTPSADQVVQPLYRSSIGKWRAYADALAPVRSQLDPWAERLGYES